MTKEKYQKEIELIKQQNNTEFELYPLAVEIIQPATEELSKRYVFNRRRSTKGNIYYGLSSFPDIAILDNAFTDKEREDEITEEDWNGLIGCLEIKALDDELFTITNIQNCLTDEEITSSKIPKSLGQLIGEILWYKKVLYTNGRDWNYFYVNKYSQELKEVILQLVNDRIKFENAETENEQLDDTDQRKEYDWWGNFINNKKVCIKDIIEGRCITENCMENWDDFIKKINEISWK